MDTTNRSSKASSTTRTETTAPSSVPPIALPDSSTKVESLVHSPGGERRVHFGAVIVMDNQLQGQKPPDHHKEDDVEKGQPPRPRQDDEEANESESESESEMPLRLSV